jgi:bis(5'-nucleosyl)-tetraphosphatase (symmetrical)
VTRYAIGDVQGCDHELRELLRRLKFSVDCDQLWLVGDLVNRGPGSLETLRLVRALGDNAIVVLGNHDLHLLALAYGADRPRRSDTLDEVLSAPDRTQLLEWLIARPLAHFAHGDLMVHAGVVPQWSATDALVFAGEVSNALQKDPRKLFDHMYGDEPKRWDLRLHGWERLRFIINVLTRLRLCTEDGRVEVSAKGRPPPQPSPLRPWFEFKERATRSVRVVFGHWSALGLVQRDGVVGLDSGCVWGGALTALDLDHGHAPVDVRCRGYQRIGE